jgi:hypothetical protein
LEATTGLLVASYIGAQKNFGMLMKDECNKQASNADWTKSHNQRDFVDHLAQKLKYKEFPNFYKICDQNIHQYGGKALLNHVFDGSVVALLNSVYPFHKWHPWNFSQAVARGFWNSKENQKEFTNWLAAELGFTHMEDWYSLKVADIIERGGIGLFIKYGSSIFKLLKSIYPEQQWFPWKFEAVPKGYWDNLNNQRDFIHWVGIQQGFTGMNDWYTITRKSINQHGGGSLLRTRYSNSLFKMLVSVYPTHNWSSHLFQE